MTDMHREAFEKWFDAEHAEYTQQTDGGKGYVQMLKSRAWKSWQAALRYRDEQDASGALSCAGCGEPADDPHTFDCPMVDRDEQEKGE